MAAGAETLSDVSFTLESGSFYFLTGASGAGKTSLLKLLYLAQRPSRGIIRLFGEDAVLLPRDRLPGFRRRIGVVFQDFRLVPHLSAADNVALPLRVAGVPESGHASSRSRRCSPGSGWPSARDARPETLSGGEQQRVAIARAVINRPEMLVADEPTGNVDPDMAERLLLLLDSLNKLGTTVVVATHDFHLLSRIPHAVMMRLDKGRLLDPTGALRYPPPRPRRVERGSAAERRVLDEAGGVRAMTGVMAVMLFLLVLAAAAGLATRERGAGARPAAGGAADGAGRRRRAGRGAMPPRRACSRRCARCPRCARRSAVDRAELPRLLRPWLGSDGADPALPVPALIDVDLRRRRRRRGRARDRGGAAREPGGAGRSARGAGCRRSATSCAR